MSKPKKHHELWSALRAHDKRFVKYVNRGKGSHYIIQHPDIAGRPAFVPIPCHGGRDVPPRILDQVIRRFNLPRGIFG